MTRDEFKAAMAEIGWKQATFSRRTGTNRVTISRWISENTVPPWAAEYLRCLVMTKHLLDAFEKDPRAQLIHDTREALLADRKVHVDEED